MKYIHEKDLDRLVGTLDRILALTVMLSDDMDRDLARRGLTQSRTAVLWLVHKSGPATQRSLADALGVSPRNVTGLVDGLEQSGFVTRGAHPTDRRATLVALTKHGERVAADLEQDQRTLARQLFQDMPSRRFDELTKGLDHVLDVVRRELAAQQADGTRGDQ